VIARSQTTSEGLEASFPHSLSQRLGRRIAAMEVLRYKRVILDGSWGFPQILILYFCPTFGPFLRPFHSLRTTPGRRRLLTSGSLVFDDDGLCVNAFDSWSAPP